MGTIAHGTTFSALCDPCVGSFKSPSSCTCGGEGDKAKGQTLLRNEVNDVIISNKTGEYSNMTKLLTVAGCTIKNGRL